MKKCETRSFWRKKLYKPLLAMKITLMLIVLNVMQVSASVYSQNTKLDLNMTNQSLVEVFKEIRNNSDFTFVYDLEDVETVNNLDIDQRGATVEEILDNCFLNTNLSYEIVDKVVIVKQKPIVAPKPVQQEKKEIKGKVTDRNGVLMPGVSVVIKGSYSGVATNIDGEYSIEVWDGAILEFSFVGKETQEFEYNGQYILNVVLEDNVEILGDVVVTGYQSISKNEATGSFGTIKASEIEKSPALNIMERLAGKIPGVDFDARNNKIAIRGQNTYGVNPGPLIVVDGFPLMEEQDGTQKLTKFTNGQSSGYSLISRVNPNDIKSITFLKDAGSASVWGSRAANGVIVIETKKGKKRAPTITFNTSIGVSSPTDLSKIKTMNSAQYVDFEKELFEKGFINDPATWYPGYYTFNTNPNTSEALEWMFRVNRGSATETQRDSALLVLSGRDNKNQIKDYLMQKAISQQYNLSVAGGGENSTYYISANATDDRSVYKNNNAKSYSFTANTTSDLFNNRISLSTGVNYTKTSSRNNTAANNAIGASTLGLRPYEMLKDGNGNNVNRYLRFRPEVIDDFTDKGYLPWTYNAIDELNYSNVLNNENLIRLNASLKARILDWLSFDLSGTYQTNISDVENEDELQSYATRDRLNRATSISSNGRLVHGIPLGGIYRTSDAKSKDYSVRGQINVNKIWNNIHSLNIIAGSEMRETKSKNYSNTLYGFDDDTYLSQVVNPTEYYQTVFPWEEQIGSYDNAVRNSKKRYLSYYSNAGYTFLNRYTASASIRYDDNSIQGAKRKDRARPFWSAGLRWNIKKEAFLEAVKVISNLNLRFSYGIGGSIPTTSGAFNSTIITITGNDNVTNRTLASIIRPANDKLSWETTKQFNAGVDLGLFKNSVNLNFDIYTKKSSGILYNMPFNGTYGYSNLMYNAASLYNHGVELGIQTALSKNNFSWNSNFTFAYNTNQVKDTRFPKNEYLGSVIGGGSPISGHSLDYLYVYRWAGLDETGQSQIYNKDGDVIKSTDWTAKLTSDDLIYAGRRTAPFVGGWSNDFSYKNFSLNVHMSYYLGHKFLKSSVENYPDYAGYNGVIGSQEDIAKRWRTPGDEMTTNVPGLSDINYNSLNRYKFSDLLVRSASHVRLQQIALSYIVPQAFLKTSLIKSLSVGISARNLGILWKKNKDGIDPQYVRTNTYNNLAPAKTFVFSLNATF